MPRVSAVNKTPFSPAFEKGHFDGLVDEGKSQSQKLALRTALAKNTKLAKNKSASICVNLRLIFSLCLRVFVPLWQKNRVNPRQSASNFWPFFS